MREKDMTRSQLNAMNFDNLPDSALVSAETVSIILGMTNLAVRNWAAAGRLKKYTLGNRTIRFRVGEIREFINRMGGDAHESHL